MSYVKNNLIKDEEIISRAKIHWIVYVKGVMLMVLAVLIQFFDIKSIIQTPIVIDAVNYLSLGILVFGVFTCLGAYIYVKTTEFVITNKRVIAKIGIVKRTTVELNHAQVESLGVEQGIFDRMLGFGTISITGTGGAKTFIPNIKNPLDFRRTFFTASA